MKTILFLLLSLGAASTTACDYYDYCHCTESNGAANDTATMQVCVWTSNTILPYPGDSWHECTAPDGAFYLSNCDWRVKCNNVQAGGQDSNCRQK